MTRPNQNSALRTSHSAFRSFWRDESGQGIVFAAVSMIMLVGFVALVYNVGHLTERRTKVQLAADACAYSGAIVVGNSLSTIGWINSAMAQVYYNSLKYAVDVNVTGTAAALERAQGERGAAWSAYEAAYLRAAEGIPRAKQCLADLSRIQNAVAILTPRLAEEEMFAVGARAGTVGDVRGAERLSLFPSLRLFPLGSSLLSYRIDQLENGWRIINLSGGNNEMVMVRLIDGAWHIEYSEDGITRHEVIIRQEDPVGDEELQRWSVRYYQPPGDLVREIYLVQTADLGWVVWGREEDPDGGETEIPRLQFDRVNMVDPPEDPPPDYDGSLDWTAGDEGTRVTYEDYSDVFARMPDGRIVFWDRDRGEYIPMSSEERVIGGVNVRVNVTSTIDWPPFQAEIGDPTHIRIGNTEIVLQNPPIIRTGLGPVSISILGFDPDSFNVSVGGFSLTHGDADGIWRKHYNRHEEYWWQHRLTEQDVPPEESALVLKRWQYDRMGLGAHLQYESNMDRYVIRHAIEDRHGEGVRPTWYAWFDPVTGAARNMTWRPTYSEPDANGIRHLQNQPPADVYYLTEPCRLCGGDGRVVCPTCNGVDNNGDGITDLNDAPSFTRCPRCNGTGEIECPGCHARDHDGAPTNTEIRIHDFDVRSRNWRDYTMTLRMQAQQHFSSTQGIYDDLYDLLDSRVYTTAYGGGTPRRPLVLAPEFFKFGLNVGAWRAPGSPMFFPDETEPDWGYIAITSARIGIADPDAPDGWHEDFDDPDERETWCYESPHNLYTGRVRPRLIPAREQIKDFDLEHDILVGDAVRPVEENGLSYLWDAVLGAGHVYGHDNWLDRYDGRPDMDVAARLRNMRNRQGRRFDYRDERLEDVVEH